MRISSAEGKWQLASWIAMGLIVVTTAYHLLAPMPNAGLAAKKHHFEETKLKSETTKLFTEVAEGRKYVEGKLWDVPSDQIGAQAMAFVDRLSRTEQVKVQAFRPQRTVSSNGITRFPYSVVVQGQFLKVLSLVRSVQDPGTKLALTSVQISAADGESDTVTATIGLAAFLASTEGRQDGKK